AGPRELRLAGGIEDAPVAADAAFGDLPGLIERLDDVVVDAEVIGARHELAQHGRLLEPSGLGGGAVVAAAWPAELGDHDALAGMLLSQIEEDFERVIDRLGVGRLVPIGQDVGGDEIDGRRELRKIAPDLPGLTGRDLYGALLPDGLDDLHQFVDVPFRLDVLDASARLLRVALQALVPGVLDRCESRLEIRVLPLAIWPGFGFVRLLRFCGLG